MNKIMEQTLLYDFYGELLTDHQRQVYEAVVLNDYSLSEVAEDLGISRQGVHDMIKRCGRILSDYEEKLHLVSRFVNQIHILTKNCQNESKESLMRKIEEISNGILEEL